MENTKRIVLGWKERVGMPELGIQTIKALISTGTQISILSTCYQEVFQKDGETWVHFGVHPTPNTLADLVNCSAKVLRFETETNEDEEETFPIISSAVEIKNLSYPVELTLKPDVDFGMSLLLGSQLLRQNFIVDVENTYLLE